MSTPSGPRNRPPWLAISFVVALLVVGANVLGYLVYRARVAPAPEPAAAEAGGGRTTRAELAAEQREAGIAALREDDFARARVLFETAEQLDPEVADIRDLLALADKLEASEARRPAPEPEGETPVPEEAPPEVSEAPEAPSVRATARPRDPPRRARRSRPDSEASAPRTGRLFVTTEPQGLLIEVDGEPDALSPAELELEPGEHRIRLLRGRRPLSEKTVRIERGGTQTLDADLRSELEPEPPAREATARGLETDRDLDLLALVDRRAEERSEAAAASAPRSAPPASTSGGRPRLVVLWPGTTRRALARSLGAETSGVEVDVRPPGSALEKDGPLAVVGSPEALRAAGLSPAWRSAPAAPERRLAVSLEGPLGRAELGSKRLGIEDRLGGRRSELFVGRLLATDDPPTVRRVDDLEDLLSMLQLSVVDVVLVEPADLPRLESRTQQKLHTLELEARERPLAVAFVGSDAAARSLLESALDALSPETRRALGLRSWTR